MRVTCKAAALVLSLCLAWQVQAVSIVGKVIKVADGDTVTVLDSSHTQHKIRLSGIDAPEQRQAFGNVSKQSLTKLVAGQSVVVEWEKTDRFGRKVGKVLLNGVDCNLLQIQRGLAWHYRAYQSEPSAADRKVYAQAEDTARSTRTGLWRDAAPLAPWDFRKMR